MVNTILYQPLELKCWRNIRAASLTSIDWLSDDGSYKVYDNPHKRFDKAIIAELEEELTTLYKKKISVTESLIFYSRPYEDPLIHIDGKNINRVGANELALNIPLLNCERSQMHWYDGNYGLSLVQTEANNNVYSLKIHWVEGEGPNEIFCQEITKPSLVRVNVPHRVVNQQSKPRIMLSMRFTPDLTFLPSLPYYGSTH